MWLRPSDAETLHHKTRCQFARPARSATRCNPARLLEKCTKPSALIPDAETPTLKNLLAKAEALESTCAACCHILRTLDTSALEVSIAVGSTDTMTSQPRAQSDRSQQNNGQRCEQFQGCLSTMTRPRLAARESEAPRPRLDCLGARNS